jgi:hypothetical protein
MGYLLLFLKGDVTALLGSIYNIKIIMYDAKSLYIEKNMT